MNKKKIIITVLIVFGACLIILFASRILRINVRTEYGTYKPTKLSFLIMEEDMSDKVILDEIERDPSLLFETNFDGNDHCLSCKTPLLAAILYKRNNLAKEMLKQGAPFKRSLELLKNNEYLIEYTEVLQKLMAEIE